MKKILALSVFCTIVAAYVSPAFGGGAGWHHSQSRMRKAHKTYLKQEAEHWKQFDAAMDQLRRGNKAKPPVTRRKQTSQPD